MRNTAVCRLPLPRDHPILNRLALPLTTSKRSPQAMAGSRYGMDLFENLARSFLYNPHEGSEGFASTVSAAVIGYGLKVFHTGCRVKAEALFTDLDRRYIVTGEKGIHLRSAAA